VVFALVAGAAFAQTANGISVQAWGRGAFAPFQAAGPLKSNGDAVKNDQNDGKGGFEKKDDKGEVYAGAGATWGGATRVDFRINGNSDYVGFSVNATAENNRLQGGDNGANIWVKPLGGDILKLTVGSFADDTLRGKIGNLDGGFSNFVLPDDAVKEEDPIFTRFRVASEREYQSWGGYNSWDFSTAPLSTQGFMISSAPIDGLFIGLMINGQLGKTLAANAWRYMQLGAGYNIANIGHARAQFIGGWSGTIDTENLTDDQYAHWWVYDPSLDDPIDDPLNPRQPIFQKTTGYPARIELAFALTAVENLLVDIGTKIWLPLEIKGSSGSVTFNKGLDLSIGANYNFGALGISALGLGARLDITGMGSYSGKADKNDDRVNGAYTVIRLVPTYAVFENVNVGLDFAVEFSGNSKKADGKDADDDWSRVGFGAFVSKGLGNGNIKAGLSYTGYKTNHDGKAFGRDMFQIPIILEYAFF